MDVLTLVLAGVLAPLAALVLLGKVVFRQSADAALRAVGVPSPRHQDRQRLERADRDGATYDVIYQAFEPLRRPIVIRRDVTELIRGARFIADRMPSEERPYSIWKRQAKEAGERLDSWTHIQCQVEPLLERKPSRKLRPDFEERLGEAVSTLRSTALDRDELGCAEAIHAFSSNIHEFVRLTESWSKLRTLAAGGIEEISREEAQDLRASPKTGRRAVYLDRDTQTYHLWRQWDALIRAYLLREQAELILQEIADRDDWVYESFCAVSRSGGSLATLLASVSGKDLLELDYGESRFLTKDRPGADERVVLVDSVVQTGARLDHVESLVNGNNATVVGSVAICWNNLLLPEATDKGEPVSEQVSRRLDEGRLVHLFYMSEIQTGAVREGAARSVERDLHENGRRSWQETTPATEARRMEASPVRSEEDLERLRADIWESDEEVEEFIAFVRELRDADLA